MKLAWYLRFTEVLRMGGEVGMVFEIYGGTEDGW